MNEHNPNPTDAIFGWDIFPAGSLHSRYHYYRIAFENLCYKLDLPITWYG